jgi:glyoxylase-like metal-dependent hydrolase (beta-lactamase superfamily II)
MILSGKGWAAGLAAALLVFAGAVSAAEIEVQWLGHATTRIISETDKVILIDPYLTTNPKTPTEYRDLKALGRVDLILVTHGHGDHSADLLALVRQQFGGNGRPRPKCGLLARQRRFRTAARARD